MLDIKPVKSGFVELPGVRLFYEIAGDGDTIVFLNGGMLDLHMWDDHFQFFAQRYQVLRYDMRSSGKSETPPSSEAYTHYQDLYQLLHALNIPKTILIGLSNGARVAIDFVLAYPDLVQKLVLVSPGISNFEFLDPWTHKRFTELLDAISRKDLSAMVETQLILWTDGPYRTPEQVDPHVRERCREMVAHAFPLSRLAPNVKELEPLAISRLSEIQVPTLVILGNKDTSDIHAIGRLLQQQIVETELVMIPDVGHTLVMDKPSEFNTLVDHFLRR